MAAIREDQAIVNLRDRVCENIDLAKVAAKIVIWERYAPYCGLSTDDEKVIKQNSEHYVNQKLRMLEQWKERSGEDATYTNLAVIFERAGDPILANLVCTLAQDQGEVEIHNRKQGETEPDNRDPGGTEPHNQQRETKSHIQRWFLFVVLTALLLTSYYAFLYQQVKHPMPENYIPVIKYVDKVKHRYKKHLPDVAQSFWLPANMHTFIQLSLTSRDTPRAPKVDQYSANQRIVSERSMTFDHLLSEIDASPGSRILVVGQPRIGKTTLLQRITRYWAHDRALSSCWILLHIVLRDLVLLQHAPNLATFLSLMGSITLPPDIETFVLESDGKGVCFIADGLDEYPAGYEDKTNFILSELIGTQKANIKLPQSTVVISSRPEVASRVWHLLEKRVEVLGFGDDQIKEYVQAKYGEDKSFSKYLDDHPHIKYTCYIPLNLAMLVYLKDYLLDKTDLPETETEIYEQFIIHTLIGFFCDKDPTSSCSRKNTLPTFLSNIDESSEIGILLFHIAKLAYIGIQENQLTFTEVEPVLQHTNSGLLVVDKMSVLQPTTYSFPHLTIQEFLAAFYFNTYLSQKEQKRVLVEYSKQPTRYVFWKFCCGLKRNENRTIFLEFFDLLYQHNNRSELPYHCAHEAQSPAASWQLINFTGGVAQLNDSSSYYNTASLAFVAASAAENLLEINSHQCGKYAQLFLCKLCGATTIYSQLRKIELYGTINFSNIKCLLEKSPNLESLRVTGLYWDKLQSEDVTALILPPYETTLLNITYIHLNIGDKGVKKFSELLQDSIFLLHLALNSNELGDDGASAVADLTKVFQLLRHIYLHGNNIGGTRAALLRNQSIDKCCSSNLEANLITGDDKPDAFISALVATISNGHERNNKSCQLQVTMSNNGLQCSDLRDIHTISKKLTERVMLKTGDCSEMNKILERFIYYINEHQPSHDIEIQWISYAACTLSIFYYTKTQVWGLVYFCCCLITFILSSFNYLLWIDYFNFILSFLWFWIVIGRLTSHVTFKLLFKLRGWVLIIIIAVVTKIIDFTLIHYQLFAFLYILLISGYVIFDLVLYPLWYYLGICFSKFYG